MIGMLNMFVRAVVAELRSEADKIDATLAAPDGISYGIRAIASAIESAAKRTLLA